MEALGENQGYHQVVLIFNLSFKFFLLGFGHLFYLIMDVCLLLVEFCLLLDVKFNL